MGRFEEKDKPEVLPLQGPKSSGVDLLDPVQLLSIVLLVSRWNEVYTIALLCCSSLTGLHAPTARATWPGRPASPADGLVECHALGGGPVRGSSSAGQSFSAVRGPGPPPTRVRPRWFPRQIRTDSDVVGLAGVLGAGGACFTPSGF